MGSFKRADDTSRKVFYKGHPPACNCASCTDARLKKLGYRKKRKGKSTYYRSSRQDKRLMAIAEDATEWGIEGNKENFTPRDALLFLLAFLIIVLIVVLPVVLVVLFRHK